jgi:predicted TIM-barrel fold metal-dependent hydrolase
MSGVFERHPSLRFVMTEGGWGPDLIGQMDHITKQIRRATSSSVEERFAGKERGGLSLLPSEYWQRQCYLGASPFVRSMARDRHSLGVDRVMFGADYPHSEGTFPYTRQAYRHLFADVPADDVAAILGGNAASAIGFDVGRLRPVADRVGPTVAEVSQPLGDDERPRDTTSMTFVGR